MNQNREPAEKRSVGRLDVLKLVTRLRKESREPSKEGYFSQSSARINNIPIMQVRRAYLALSFGGEGTYEYLGAYAKLHTKALLVR